MTKRLTGITGTLALLALVAGCERTAEEAPMIRPVKAIQVAGTGDFARRWFPGTAKATQEVDLAFRVAGPLITFPVKVGDFVEVGHELARIDPRDYEVQLRNAEGQLEDGRAALRRAKSEYERIIGIYEKDPGATSATAVDRKRESRDRAAAGITSLEAAVDAANDALSYTYLKAPFAGTVVATYVENFESVRAKQSIVRLLDSSRVEMVVNIPENLVSMVPSVSDIRVTFDAFPGREVAAELKEIGTEASRTTRTYPITLIMNQPDDFEILAGMAGQATGRVDEKQFSGADALSIPVSAAFSSGEAKASFVWIVDPNDNIVHKREITVDEVTDQGLIVTAGLEAGEWVVTAGVNYLSEGQQVKLPDIPEA